jgi:outer membrane protein OmpA-like peptidoglycan-associated protein
MFRKVLFAIPVIALAAGSTACATKGMVRTSVGEVNAKVDSQGRAIEETQERTRRNEGRIAEVDQKAEAAAQSARAANDSAAAAKAFAGERFDVLDKASKKLVYEVVLSEDQGNFKFGATELPDEAKARIDAMVQQLKTDPKAIYLEIEGHTDNVGDPKTNERIGLERAEAVKRYLYDQYQIPLHKMNVISYGEAKPAAPNNTRDGRAQNRRVVIKVLA